jgi:hypothetical protein
LELDVENAAIFEREYQIDPPLLHLRQLDIKELLDGETPRQVVEQGRTILLKYFLSAPSKSKPSFIGTIPYCCAYVAAAEGSLRPSSDSHVTAFHQSRARDRGVIGNGRADCRTVHLPAVSLDGCFQASAKIAVRQLARDLL